MKKIYRTVYEVVVLSEGPLELASRDDDPFGLLAINYEIVDGCCIGMVEEKDSRILPPSSVRHALITMGNDGEFFDDV